jgi:hypothetical protein
MIVIDRSDVIHGLGARELSPALRDGAPALAALGDSDGRCGWAPFFAALDAHRLAVDLGEGEARLVPRGEARPEAHAGSALAEASAFLDAVRGR